MSLRSFSLRTLLGGLFLILACTPSWGRHLVGGDFTYFYLGRTASGLSQYRISLNLYRDCLPNGQFPTNTPFDKVVTVRIFEGDIQKKLYTEVNIELRDSTILDITSSDPCVPAPDNLCYTKTSYTTTVQLEDNPNGYYLAWARCCRNEDIVNLINPGAQGMVLSAYIPNTALENSSANFTNNVPTYICQNDLCSTSIMEHLIRMEIHWFIGLITPYHRWLTK